MAREIVTTYVEIDGRKVPYHVVPPGISGLTPEAREALDLRMKIKGYEDDSLDTIELRVKDKIDKYLDDGEIDSEIEEYISTINDVSLETSHDELT